MRSKELLQEIEAWLSFNTEPSKEETAKLRRSIKNHLTEQQCTTPNVRYREQKKKKKSEIKLEVGKTYQSRKGEEVKITGFAEGIQYPYKGDKGKWYAEAGQWCNKESPYDLIEEVPETRHTFQIPDWMKEVTVSQVSNRIIVEMVPEIKEPKPGDVMVNEHKGVYIFKSDAGYGNHNYYAWVGKSGRLSFEWTCAPGRPATPEEAKPLWDALKKGGEALEPGNYAGGGCTRK